MAGEKRSLMATVRALALIIWVITSVAVFATLCFVAAPVNIALSRKISLFWMRMFLRLGGVSVKVSGLQNLQPDKRYVFIANHQSYLDIPVMFASLQYPLSFIAKKELFRIPFFGWGMYAVGHIWIDRENARKAHASIKQAVARMQKENFSLVLFPEGTRSADGTIGQFKQGSFSLAQQAGAEVVPVTIRDTFRLLPKRSWLVAAGTVTLVVGKPICIDEAMSKAEISERVRTIINEALERGTDSSV